MRSCHRPVILLGTIVMLAAIPAPAQGPGGYNPPGQGVDLSGNRARYFTRIPMSAVRGRGCVYSDSPSRMARAHMRWLGTRRALPFLNINARYTLSAIFTAAP